MKFELTLLMAFFGPSHLSSGYGLRTVDNFLRVDTSNGLLVMEGPSRQRERSDTVGELSKRHHGLRISCSSQVSGYIYT